MSGTQVKVTFCEGYWNSSQEYKTLDTVWATAQRKNNADKKLNGNNRDNHFSAVERMRKYLVLEGEVNNYMSKTFPSLEAAYKFMSRYHNTSSEHMISIHRVTQSPTS